MSNEGCEKNQPPGQGSETPAGVGADRTRRRLTGAGLAGAGVLMTVSSRTALGQVGCGSESASAAMSRNGVVPDCGCSPGFWWNTNGQRVWGDFIESSFPQFSRGSKFNDVFCQGLPPGVNKFFPDDSVTLLQARLAQGDYPKSNYDGCASIHAIGMHAVAALLNVAFYGDRYPAEPRFSTPSEVIQALQDAMTAYATNNKGNPCSHLTAFKDRVDVYNGLWCFNGKDWGY